MNTTDRIREVEDRVARTEDAIGALHSALESAGNVSETVDQTIESARRNWKVVVAVVLSLGIIALVAAILLREGDDA